MLATPVMQSHAVRLGFKMLLLLKKIRFNKVWIRLFILILVLSLAKMPSVGAQGLSQSQIRALQSNIFFYDTGNNGCSAGSVGGISSLDRWMQAEAIAESGNYIKSVNLMGAYGKYQIIPSTWAGLTTAYYPPGSVYAVASSAPASVQDAVVYLSNISTFIRFKGDPFWMAINWYDPLYTQYYPNKKAPELNVIPAPGNNFTLAQFGNEIAGAVSSGNLNGISLNSVTLSYNQAPEFQTYLVKAGGEPASQQFTNTSIVSGNCAAASSSSSSCPLVGNSKIVTGPNAAILCEAEKYNGIYYQLGGGHGYLNFRQACPEASIPSAVQASTSSSPGPCATDCSGLVSVAVDAVYNQTFDWIVTDSSGIMTGSGSSSSGAPSSYWQSIPISEAQAGDIVTSNSGDGYSTPGTDGHVEIVEYVSGNTVYTFGSHSPGKQTGTISSNESGWNGGAWRYVGPGQGSGS